MPSTPPIVQFSRLISALANGQAEKVEKECILLLKEEGENAERNEFLSEVLNLAKKLLETRDFILNLSNGNLAYEAPRNNRLFDPFKDLQANLRHLVWQTQEIARGNFSHHVDFLGDFSHSFNTLVDSLREKKKLEEALKTSEEHYRNIFENSMEGIYQSSFDGKLQRINPTFARLFGYDSPAEDRKSVVRERV